METQSTLRRFAGMLAAAATWVPAAALAEPPDWSVAGAGSGASPVDGPYDAEYGVGFMGGLGVYRSLLPELGVGLRVDGGSVAGEEERAGSVSDGALAFGALSPALRYRPLRQLGLEDHDNHRGLYLELAGGVGLLEDQVEPVLAPSAGYIFDIGSVGVGPTARYLQLVTGEGDAPGGEDVRIMTVGVELVFLDEDRRPRAPSEEQPPEQLRPAPAARQIEREPPRQDVQAQEVQPVAGRDAVSSVGPIALDERVVFDTGAATVSAAGKRELDRIVEMYRDASEREGWSLLRVSGHADQRGASSYNLELSRKRAESVRDYLVSRGVPASLIDIRAYGEEQPIIAEPETAAELEQNRRVQFEIVRGGSSEPE